MFLELDSRSLVAVVMGVPDPELFLSEKELATEFKFIASAGEDADRVLHHHHQERKEDEEEKGREELEEEDFSMDLRKSFPTGDSAAASGVDGGHCEANSDGFKTPTSPASRIPAIPQCPPAPRKPKRSLLTKRKPAARPCVFLDLSSVAFDSVLPSAPSEAELLSAAVGGRYHAKKKSRRGGGADGDEKEQHSAGDSPGV